MKLLGVETLEIPDVKLIRYGHFPDDRGFFTESFRKSDIENLPESCAISGKEIVQINESVSRPGVMRGLHFQWNPYMGKLVRTIRGHMVDMFLDIRQGSPTYRKIVLCDMPCKDEENQSEWLWIPPGFAHGNFFLGKGNTKIEYLCTGEYSPGYEAEISPLADDLDWTLCDGTLKTRFDELVASNQFTISEKDRAGITFNEWAEDERSSQFIFGEC